MPEIFNYLKWALLVVLMAAVSRQVRRPPSPMFSALFLLVLLDDSLQFHERAGGVLAGVLDAGDHVAQAAGEIAC